MHKCMYTHTYIQFYVFPIHIQLFINTVLHSYVSITVLTIKILLMSSVTVHVDGKFKRKTCFNTTLLYF